MSVFTVVVMEVPTAHRMYWLMKAEPESRFEKGVDVKFSIDDLKNAREPEPWDGEYRNLSLLILIFSPQSLEMLVFLTRKCLF